VAVLALGLLPGAPARAYYCEDIAGEHVVTGESRYRTNPSTDSCYTNQYYDTGNELKLLCGFSPGVLPTAGESATWVTPAFGFAQVRWTEDGNLVAGAVAPLRIPFYCGDDHPGHTDGGWLLGIPSGEDSDPEDPILKQVGGQYVGCDPPQGVLQP
jgi:hypothetical protein